MIPPKDLERPADRTALSYWFPLIEAAGLPVPRTRILSMPEAAQREIWDAFDGKAAAPVEAQPFFDALAAAATEMGFPCFLRTDHTSGKHSWEKACHLASAADIPSHVFAIAEFSECVDFFGLPWRVWAVREMLPTIPHGTCRRYGNMPICREFRFFVEDGTVRCWHPYWPHDSLLEGGASGGFDYDALCRMENEAELVELAAAAGRAVGGAWSVDILETRRGWFVTDMAEAARSFHWKDCPAPSRDTASLPSGSEEVKT